MVLPQPVSPDMITTYTYKIMLIKRYHLMLSTLRAKIIIVEWHASIFELKIIA